MRSRLVCSSLAAAAAILVAVVVTSCADGAPLSPRVQSSRFTPGVQAAHDGLVGTLQLLACGSAETLGARGTVGPEGGTVAVGNTRIDIPAGAVGHDTDFEVIVPASQLMEVEIHAVGQQSYQFQRPVIITIDYSRCGALALPVGAVPQGVHIDSVTKSILERMGGLVDSSARSVSFLTGHLSGYAVAY